MNYRLPVLLAIVFALFPQSGFSAAAPSSSTRNFTDMAGHTVTIPMNATRVGDLWPANNEVGVMLGAGRKLVATSKVSQSLPWIKTTHPGFDKIAAPFTVGGVNLEELLKADPCRTGRGRDSDAESHCESRKNSPSPSPTALRSSIGAIRLVASGSWISCYQRKVRPFSPNGDSRHRDVSPFRDAMSSCVCDATV